MTDGSGRIGSSTLARADLYDHLRLAIASAAPSEGGAGCGAGEVLPKSVYAAALAAYDKALRRDPNSPMDAVSRAADAVSAALAAPSSAPAQGEVVGKSGPIWAAITEAVEGRDDDLRKLCAAVLNALSTPAPASEAVRELAAAITPETPLLIPANTLHEMRDAGFEVVMTGSREDAMPGASDDEVDAIDRPTEEEIACWEPIRPDGEGWLLHCKGFLGEDGDTFGAVWYRRALTPPSEAATKGDAI